jgi:hypothetical protein
VSGALPEWPGGTVTILVTAGATPHAIPVSAAIRAGPRHALLGLASTRGSLERLRANPAVALVIIAPAIAVTAHGRARALEDELTQGVVPVLIEVEHVQDHDRPTFEILGGVGWRWSDESAQVRDEEVRSGLRKLAERLMLGDTHN